MKKVVLLFVFGLLVSWFSVANAVDFGLSFVIDNTFEESGLATVKKKITLTNLTTASYPSAYFVDLPPDSTSVVAFDEEGKTHVSIIEEEGQKRAKIEFNQESIGYGKAVTLILSYETMTLIQTSGETRTIAIPGFESADPLVEYVVSISFPAAWGTPKRIIPPADKPYVWTLTERSSAPIAVSFDILPSPTPVPTNTPPVAIVPIALGLSVGIVGFAVVFELVKRYL